MLKFTYGVRAHGLGHLGIRSSFKSTPSVLC